MSDWPAPYSCSSSVPGPRRQSLKGCMGALPQMFQWSRMLGSNNKCIATTADVQTVPEIKRWAKQGKSQHREGGLGQNTAVSNGSVTGSSSVSRTVSDRSVCRETDQTASMVLRQILHAKQEPFVLLDVIREKRQPMRTNSSRELKFGAPSTRRSLKMKNGTTSKDQEQAADDGDSAACPSQYCVPSKASTGSAAVVRRNRVPVESMVAMPSYQVPALCGVNSAEKAHSKTASQGRTPVKSPNKRALLMEAAARILEGSNHRTSKRPSTSVRSLLEELEKSKHVKELSAEPKEKLVRAVVLQSDSSERETEVLSPNVVILRDKAAESKQHQKSYDLKLLGKHNGNSSCKHHVEMLQTLEKDLFVMQNRVFPYDNALDEAEVLPSLATPVQNPGSENKSEHVQLHDDLWSGMKGTQKETTNQIVKSFKLDSSEVLLQAKTGEDQKIEPDHDALLKDSRAIVPSTSIDSAADLPPVMLTTCLRAPNFDKGTPSLIRIVLDYSVARHFTMGYLAAAPFAVSNPEKRERSSARSTERSLIEGADETGYAYRARDIKAIEAERQSSVMQLRLCNYSWWANSRQTNSPEKGENRLSIEYRTGYNSPVAACRCPCSVKICNAERKDCEEEACVCVDEFQQASPVSVLEPVYDEELELGNTFDNFEEARQKLLEKVRRYEMLADMDVDMLKKVSEEHVSYAWDDDEINESADSWETDDSSSSSSASFEQASPATHDHFSSSNVEAQEYCRKRFKEPYEDNLYGQEVEMRPPTSSLDGRLKKLEPRPISCRVLRLDHHIIEGTEASLQSQRLVSGDEVGGCSSGPIVGAYVVNSLLHKDLTKSNWSSSKEEEEEVELELEGCFFDLLVCELLSDLLKAQLKPFCNACNAFDLCT